MLSDAGKHLFSISNVLNALVKQAYILHYDQLKAQEL